VRHMQRRMQFAILGCRSVATQLPRSCQFGLRILAEWDALSGTSLPEVPNSV